MRRFPNDENLRASLGGAICVLLLLLVTPAQADCPPVPTLFEAAPDRLLADLSATPEKARALLKAMDKYSVAMEACYDSPMGPLELAPFAQQATLLAEKMHRMRDLAEANVRGDEFAFEDLLSSDLCAILKACASPVPMRPLGVSWHALCAILAPMKNAKR